MGNRILLMFALAASPLSAAATALTPAPAPAPAEAAPGTFAKVDAAIAEAHRSMQALQECVKVTAALRADHAQKQQELKGEFGAVPPAFNELLLRKRKRLDKQEEACLALMPQPGLLFTQAHELLRNIEPRNVPGVVGRFKKVEAGRVQYNRLIAKPKAAAK